MCIRDRVYQWDFFCFGQQNSHWGGIVTCPKLGYFISYSMGHLHFYLFHFLRDFIKNLLWKFYYTANVISITTEHMASRTVWDKGEAQFLLCNAARNSYHPKNSQNAVYVWRRPHLTSQDGALKWRRETSSMQKKWRWNEQFVKPTSQLQEMSLSHASC